MEPPKDCLRKSWSENTQQIYRTTPMLSVISIKLLCNFIGITFGMGVLLYVFSIFSEHLFLRTSLDRCFWRIPLKSFSGARSKQLNPNLKPTLDKCKYDSVIVHLVILPCKNESELEELPTNIIEIGKTCKKVIVLIFKTKLETHFLKGAL